MSHYKYSDLSFSYLLPKSSMSSRILCTSILHPVSYMILFDQNPQLYIVYSVLFDQKPSSNTIIAIFLLFLSLCDTFLSSCHAHFHRKLQVFHLCYCLRTKNLYISSTDISDQKSHQRAVELIRADSRLNYFTSKLTI